MPSALVVVASLVRIAVWLVSDHSKHERAFGDFRAMEKRIGETSMELRPVSVSRVNPAPLASAWYLVQCKPRQDARAQEHLMRQGYVCCRPMCYRGRIVRGRHQTFTESLFPGYLFIQITDDANWSPLRSTRGVSHVVGFGGKPLPVNDQLVSELQRRSYDSPPEFQVGDKVRILRDGFAEVDAIFMAMTGDERVILLINLLNCAQELTLPLESVVSY